MLTVNVQFQADKFVPHCSKTTRSLSSLDQHSLQKLETTGRMKTWSLKIRADIYDRDMGQVHRCLSEQKKTHRNLYNVHQNGKTIAESGLMILLILRFVYGDSLISCLASSLNKNIFGCFPALQHLFCRLHHMWTGNKFKERFGYKCTESQRLVITEGVKVPSLPDVRLICAFFFAQPFHSIMGYTYKQVMVKLLKIHLHPSFLVYPQRILAERLTVTQGLLPLALFLVLVKIKMKWKLL